MTTAVELLVVAPIAFMVGLGVGLLLRRRRFRLVRLNGDNGAEE